MKLRCNTRYICETGKLLTKLYVISTRNNFLFWTWNLSFEILYIEKYKLAIRSFSMGGRGVGWLSVMIWSWLNRILTNNRLNCLIRRRKKWWNSLFTKLCFSSDPIMKENHFFRRIVLKFYYTIIIAHLRFDKEQKDQDPLLLQSELLVIRFNRFIDDLRKRKISIRDVKVKENLYNTIE